MSQVPYTKRQVNMMRVNALRREGSIAKNLFIAYLCGVHELEFDAEQAKKYPEDAYAFKEIVASIPNIDKLHDQINTYRAAQILKLLGTSVDNKKLSFLTAHKDPDNSMSTQEVLDVIKADLERYQLLLDAFICHGHRQAIRELRSKIKDEFNMNNEQIKAYRIYMKIPVNLQPLVDAYGKQIKAQPLAAKSQS